MAREVVAAGERLGFDITLIAERLLGPDLEAWMLGTTLAAVAPRIHVMIAVHPGLWAPQIGQDRAPASTASPVVAST